MQAVPVQRPHQHSLITIDGNTTSSLKISPKVFKQLPSFSVGELYKRIFFRTQCRMPEEKYKDGTARERHPAPIHLLLTQGAPVPRSIQLSAFRARDLESTSEKEDANTKDLLGTPKEKDPPKDLPQIDCNLEMQKVPAESEGPRLIFAIRLSDTFRPESDMLDHFTDWMRSFPTIAHEMKVEAVFDSLSTLVLVSLPMNISAYLPHDLAILSLGPITSSNRMHLSPGSEHNTKTVSWGKLEQSMTHPTPDPPSSNAVKPTWPKDLLVDNSYITPLKPLAFTQKRFPWNPYRNSSILSRGDNDLRWGKLFDDEGKPTSRLGQFLRGVANHIINEYVGSLLIIPSKMVLFYSKYPLDVECHPFFKIFRTGSNEKISRLYQELGCQYCLIQEDVTERPAIPALTSIGFAHWEAIQIVSNPTQEWQRLSKVVRETSIIADNSIVEGKPEPLPSHLPRHLFPPAHDRETRKFIQQATDDFLDDFDSLTRRGAKADYVNPLSSGSRHVDLLLRHLRYLQMLKLFENLNESAYSTSSFGSYRQDFSRWSSSRIGSSGSSVFSAGRYTQYRPPSRPRRTDTTKSKEPPSHLFTCLLDTCTASCPDGCSKISHYYPFCCDREDEMKIHLDAEHPYHDITFPLPASWSKPNVRTISGWTCDLCGEPLGTWDARKETIETHWEKRHGSLTSITL